MTDKSVFNERLSVSLAVGKKNEEGPCSYPDLEMGQSAQSRLSEKRTNRSTAGPAFSALIEMSSIGIEIVEDVYQTDLVLDAVNADHLADQAEDPIELDNLKVEIIADEDAQI